MPPVDFSGGNWTLSKDSSVQLEEGGDLHTSTDLVEVIVVMEEQPLIKEAVEAGLAGNMPAYLTMSSTVSLEKAMLRSHDAARAEIAVLCGDQADTDGYDYTTVLNGFSMTMPYGKIAEAEALPGVKYIRESRTYNVPEDQSSYDLAMSNSTGMIGSDVVNEMNFDGADGAGTLVAILDTGIAEGHEAFKVDPEDLSAAVLKQTAKQQTALEAALRAQKWFEGVKKQLRHIRPEPADAPTTASKPEYTPPDAEPLTRQTAPEALETFYVLALKTTGKSPSRDEVAQLSILKFRRFAPESVLSAYVCPEKGLTKYARETGVTERMTQGAPKLAQLLPAVDAYLGDEAPLVLFRADDLAFLGAAGSEAACAKRPVYDVRTLTGHKTAPLADAFGAAFEFVPCLADAEDEALACGLLFCTLADRALHLTAKR